MSKTGQALTNLKRFIASCSGQPKPLQQAEEDLNFIEDRISELLREKRSLKEVTPPDPKPTPIPMRLPCPDCGELHIDEGEFASKPHHTHSCQHCGLTWRPAVVHTVGVRFLPGFKNESRGFTTPAVRVNVRVHDHRDPMGAQQGDEPRSEGLGSQGSNEGTSDY
jgi:hypothetical protein